MVWAGLRVTSNEIWGREMDKNPKLLQNDGFDGFDGSRRWVFGVREMCKNPILWTTLTGLTGLAGLTGLTERSRMLNGRSDVPKCSKTQHFERL